MHGLAGSIWAFELYLITYLTSGSWLTQIHDCRREDSKGSSVPFFFYQACSIRFVFSMLGSELPNFAPRAFPESSWILVPVDKRPTKGTGCMRFNVFLSNHEMHILCTESTTAETFLKFRTEHRPIAMCQCCGITALAGKHVAEERRHIFPQAAGSFVAMIRRCVEKRRGQ